ncbi:MAG TPA: imidazoleglycerol-phosphate dehydratase HisB [Longimicrobiaceae bacterium]|nr:imidazoleglycerol-phosphate dehydratase HisB [Longimicrobiaceae bacterium]
MSRTARRERKTKETEIRASLALDGTGEGRVKTGIGFFDHMLEALARHGLFDLEVECSGDLHVDAHHTVEDVGIVLGACFLEALGDKRGISRYADATVPLDEALVRAVVDVSGRPFLHFDVPYPADQPVIGQFDVALSAEFWRAFATEARLTMHLDGIRGDNAHHVVEATFKAAARALDAATRLDPRRGDAVPSTKGAL